MLYLATGNAHKAAEFRAILAHYGSPLSVEIVPEMPSVAETADTYAGNARLKSRAAQTVLPSGSLVVADDSGLEVGALNGAPGLYSARYAGAGASDGDNLAKLLQTLASSGYPPPWEASFICVLVLRSAEHEALFTGRCPGVVLPQPAGAKGFGYDPAFQPNGFAETFATLGDTVKCSHSHRARAIQTMLRQWPSWGTTIPSRR